MQATATRERILTDRGNAVGYNDACQATAIPERPPTDRGHAVGDSKESVRFSDGILHQGFSVFCI